MRSTPKCDIMRAYDVGIIVMKTKIIYISGSEVFDIADIRAAFDEVRNALSLDTETILFGVPVDNDSAFENTAVPNDVVQPNINNISETLSFEKQDIVSDHEPDKIKSDIEMPVEKPKKATRHTKAVPMTPIETAAIDTTETEHPAEETPNIPILSVLGAKSDTDATQTNTESDDTPIVDSTPIDVIPVQDKETTIETDANMDTQSVSISDMLTDDIAPVENREKTLEELLESMTPLGEDEKIATKPIDDFKPDIESESIQTSNDDTDETLKLLATEFAESEDKIVAPTKTETRGTIGKLKNILPFK